MAKKKKNGWELVAQQIKQSQNEVARLNKHKEIMSGKGEGDLTGMSKAEQTMWFKLGQRMTSDDYKRRSKARPISDREYDNYVRKGIAQEYAGRWDTLSRHTSGGYANYMAQRKKKKRIV